MADLRVSAGSGGPVDESEGHAADGVDTEGRGGGDDGPKEGDGKEKSKKRMCVNAKGWNLRFPWVKEQMPPDAAPLEEGSTESFPTPRRSLLQGWEPQR